MAPFTKNERVESCQAVLQLYILAVYCFLYVYFRGFLFFNSRSPRGTQNKALDPVQVCASKLSLAAVRSDGELVTWGDPEYGGHRTVDPSSRILPSPF